MKLILTHEQADFDAIASLLAASLLDEQARAVLPRKMNRNVRAFLSLYAGEFGLTDPRDLPAGETIEALTLVDSQSFVSLKGLTAQTRVRVIDHHPLREDLPADWQITVAGTGANTTILIEMLQEREISLHPLQASLLLLGIYEDTGSLTYTRTTGRDLRAAAFLVESGASLKLALEYLNHPLSPGQQRLFRNLHDAVERLDIHGYRVLITRGDATGMDEELSTIAHKLRDVLEPDALFLLVLTRAGVQMIGRSTTDQVDVARILGQFGGGGHERAAACLVKGGSLDQVHAELMGHLKRMVQPAVTVAQLMSINPQLLEPQTLVGEAAERMQRFGYEGFPVVQSGQVIGLVTRRAVDRALAHKLVKATVKDLMEAGEYSVSPDDSLQHLQALMTESGWGQVPVRQPAGGQIIGIVTRTDVMKSLMPQPRPPGRQNLAARLEKALTPELLELLRQTAQAAAEMRLPIYIVGGFVRDLLLDRPGQDFDLVVEGDAIHLAKALAAKFGGRVTSHSRFGTAKWLLDSAHSAQNLDLITARTEFYTHPTALPTVERSSIKLDLHRRDFTINTLALRLDGDHFGRLYDYWGGLADLRYKRVRVLHSLSFVDDPTRMLRAARFEQRFGFSIERRTLDLMSGALSLIDRLSGERIRHELNAALLEDRFESILARMDALGLLRAIHPRLVWNEAIAASLRRAAAASPEPGWGLAEPVSKKAAEQARLELAYLIWLAALNCEKTGEIIARLKFPARAGQAALEVCSALADRALLASAAPAELVERLAGLSPQGVYAAALASADAVVYARLFEFASRLRHVHPATTGDDLRRLGLPAGPAYRRVLDGLRRAWINGDITSPTQESEYLAGLLAGLPAAELRQTL